jgi:hypothetical protein
VSPFRRVTFSHASTSNLLGLEAFVSRHFFLVKLCPLIVLKSMVASMLVLYKIKQLPVTTSTLSSAPP